MTSLSVTDSVAVDQCQYFFQCREKVCPLYEPPKGAGKRPEACKYGALEATRLRRGKLRKRREGLKVRAQILTNPQVLDTATVRRLWKTGERNPVTLMRKGTYANEVVVKQLRPRSSRDDDDYYLVLTPRSPFLEVTPERLVKYLEHYEKKP